jgi:hypothetical protein
VLFVKFFPLSSAACAGNDLQHLCAFVWQYAGCSGADYFVVSIDGCPDLDFVVEGLSADIESGQFIYTMF